MNARTFAARRSLLVLLLCLVPVASSADQPQGLILLQRGGTTLGIKPDAGGRAMLLQRAGGGNILKADPALFATTPPEPAADSGWKAFNGHITWIGPQEHFWTRQDRNPERRDRQAHWPPDPYIIYGRFKVARQTPDRLVLEGPDSPVSGVRLCKEYQIREDGSVWHRVTATNIRPEPVTFNLWSNTRVEGDRTCFIPVPDTRFIVGTTLWSPYRKRSLPWDLSGEWFYFRSCAPAELPASLEALQNKGSFFPLRGVIIAVGDNDALVKQFVPVAENSLFPGQGAAEIFQRVSRVSEENICELEFYGAYQTLRPGASASTEELWTILPYRGGKSPAERLNWVKTLSLPPAGLTGESSADPTLQPQKAPALK